MTEVNVVNSEYPYRLILDEEAKLCTLYLNVPHFLRYITVITAPEKEERKWLFNLIANYVRIGSSNRNYPISNRHGKRCFLFLSLVNFSEANLNQSDFEILAKATFDLWDSALDYWLERFNRDVEIGVDSDHRNKRAFCMMYLGFDPMPEDEAEIDTNWKDDMDYEAERDYYDDSWVVLE